MTHPSLTTMPAKHSCRGSKITHCRLHCRPIHTSIDLPAMTEVYSRLKCPSILGGNPAVADTGGFSYWAADPKEIVQFSSGQKDPFGMLQAVLSRYQLAGESQAGLPRGVFRGGWIGYFGYELGRYIERLPQSTVDDLQMPLIRLCFYDRWICWDHAENLLWLMALEVPGDCEAPHEKLDVLERPLARSRRIDRPGPAAADLEDIDLSQFRCNMDKDYYLRSVERIKRYIYDGDVYQVNFSQRFECDCDARPIELYHWQNHFNPSGYAAYVDAGAFQIVSASPEMFITVDDDLIQTRPVKGTRPRFQGASRAAKRLNADNFNELLHSRKEQAELNMIIDLERNDIARICRPGTRKVIQPRAIETCPTVFHAVATIAGRLRSEVTFCDVLRAMFPGGSITGAPKIRSMEIIDEMEPTARGVYTGSMGFIGLDGTVRLNIAIRTIIITRQKAFVQVGGGIVADSDLRAEWQETLTKARALLAAIISTRGAG
jgi:para-aminobenzoate synthetase component 1